MRCCLELKFFTSCRAGGDEHPPSKLGHARPRRTGHCRPSATRMQDPDQENGYLPLSVGELPILSPRTCTTAHSTNCFDMVVKPTMPSRPHPPGRARLELLGQGYSVPSHVGQASKRKEERAKPDRFCSLRGPPFQKKAGTGKGPPKFWTAWPPY